MKPNLVLIIGDMAIRYVNGKQHQTAIIDFEQRIDIIKRHIEHFRVNGLKE